ncbi:MAG TPA: hypothetical protein VIQ97_02270, partial [Prevotella sp.]
MVQATPTVGADTGKKIFRQRFVPLQKDKNAATDTCLVHLRKKVGATGRNSQLFRIFVHYYKGKQAVLHPHCPTVHTKTNENYHIKRQ